MKILSATSAAAWYAMGGSAGLMSGRHHAIASQSRMNMSLSSCVLNVLFGASLTPPMTKKRRLTIVPLWPVRADGGAPVAAGCDQVQFSVFSACRSPRLLDPSLPPKTIRLLRCRPAAWK